MKQNINYTYLENICLHCRVSDRGTPIRVLLRANQNSVQAISNRSRSKNDDIVVIGSFFNTRLSF